MTVRTVLKVPFEKAAPPCPSDVPAPLARVNRENKSHADWTNQHILEMNREEKERQHCQFPVY